MGMFYTRKPRGFQHTYIYVDERKERLKHIEEHVKRETGQLLPQAKDQQKMIFRSMFREQTNHLRCRQPKHKLNPTRTLATIVIIVVLLYLCQVVCRLIAT